MDALKSEISDWSASIKEFSSEYIINYDIEEYSHKSGGNNGPSIIELLGKGESSAGGADASFEDKDGDGVIIIDVKRSGSD